MSRFGLPIEVFATEISELGMKSKLFFTRNLQSLVEVHFSKKYNSIQTDDFVILRVLQRCVFSFFYNSHSSKVDAPHKKITLNSILSE